jgi:myosin heavy subunit
MRKLALLAAIALTVAGCDASKEKLNTAMADNQRISAEKDSLLTEVMANTTLVNDINTELAKARNLGANPVAPGEASGSRATADRQVVLGKIRDAITRLNESEAQLERSKTRLASMSKKDNRLIAQINEYQKTVADLKTTIEQQQAEYTAIIDSQKVQIVALHATVDTATQVNTKLTTEKQALIDTMNTVYYTVGTKDELVKKGVAVQEGSKFLVFGGHHLAAARSLTPPAFTIINRMQDSVIPLPDSTKNYKIITRQNLEFTQGADKDGKFKGQIRITSPEQFWAASKYLIVRED